MGRDRIVQVKVRTGNREGDFVFKKRPQNSENTRRESGSSQSGDSGAVPPDDPSQPIDPSVLPEEWSPDQKVFPDDVNVEPESIGLQFHDPVAEKTEWEFAESDRTAVSELRLAKTDQSRLEYRTNTTWIGIVLIVGGIIIGSLGAVRLASGEMAFNFDRAFSFLFSLAAVVFGIFLSFIVQRVVFDKFDRVFWKGRTIGRAKRMRCSAKLEDIYAIQIVDEWCGDESSTMNYQLNIVLKDGGRVNVFEDKKQEKIREAAKLLAEYLGRPVWDATK
jgi:hypothetical protein